ncbi:putative transmembrane protein [Labilithrix luteola]|uniref:Putative transmembrane protein n=1 Tax=Labilithrix luteola TaxID=1391654 RepID=A0A0K1PZG3_9BACT|nr:YeeE/YedE family protein [Labilithrix luteola]AKU98925.1 putative transmembrane protein [Labilithrix luteola]
MQNFTPGSALVGGALIGLSASIYLLGLGRIAGISGILASATKLDDAGDGRGEKVAFLAGLLAAGIALRLVAPSVFSTGPGMTLPWVVAAGLLVGYGTRLGGGCTSGHGVCGLSRLSIRSLAATVTFMATGALTVWVVRHVFEVTP